jgi:hypothetical protein
MDTISWPPYLCLFYFRYLSYPSVRGKSEPLYGTHPPWGRRPIILASNCRGNNFTQDETVKETHFHSENSLSTIRQSKAGSLANPSSINHVRDWNEHHEYTGRSSTDAQIYAHCDMLHSARFYNTWCDVSRIRSTPPYSDRRRLYRKRKKLKLSLCLNKHHAVEAYGEMGAQLHALLT